MSGPAGFGGTRDEVIQLRGQGAQADLLELSGEIIVRHHVGVLGAGEFIVGLQIVRADIERLGLRMVAEIDG